MSRGRDKYSGVRATMFQSLLESRTHGGLASGIGLGSLDALLW